MTSIHGIVIVALFALLSAAESTPFKRCDRGVAPISVNVLGCSRTPCQVYRGHNVTAIVAFRSPTFANVLVPRVRALVDLWFTTYKKEIPFSQKNACSTLTRGRCPLRRGDYAEYYFSFPVSVSEPSVNCDVEVSLNNAAGATVGCARLPVSLL